MPAEAVPQVVVAAVGDRAAVAVAQQLPVRWRVAFPGVPEQRGHEGGRDRLPPDGGGGENVAPRQVGDDRIPVT